MRKEIAVVGVIILVLGLVLAVAGKSVELKVGFLLNWPIFTQFIPQFPTVNYSGLMELGLLLENRTGQNVETRGTIHYFSKESNVFLLKNESYYP